ncbi:electron transport complex subunit RsxC [Endozoicomonas elysicola]|uniref:electron transport complex subunit RsxC n=1 Tax=Endozoicomonas elysicola TaxID=305900 RepID=UPI0003AA80F9|nr:electron transport complex subunit RsxC [Endozoicomonas elysicola]
MIASSERKIWPLTGGVHPEENKHQSTGCPVSVPPLPKTLVLPLSQHAGAPADPIISVGDQVLKGQMIAKASGFVSAALHAPTSGIITAIENRPIPHASGMYDLCIILDTDGQDQWCELAPVADYRQLSSEELVEKVRNAGISGMGGAGFPTAIKLAPNTTINTLILNGTECEPYITADDMLMREKAEAVIQGAEILQYMLGAQECLIGIEDNKPEAISAMRKAATGKNIYIVVFPTIYPSGGEKQLIQILTGQEVPSGKLPADLGMVVQNVGTAVSVKEAILEGKPLISRITTLTGDALATPQNVDALIGTLAEDLLHYAALKESELATLVFGGPMMGFSVDRMDIPVIKTSNCLIAATQDEFPDAPDAQACIRCGHCAEACPSSLLPQQLYWHAKAENHEQLMHHNLFDCIECGACSFVCPSSIPLVQYYRASKGAIRTQEAKHAKSERSKQRYEGRLARLEQEKAEKEAKRKANAERAAKLKAAKAAENTESDAKAEEDPIQAAIARAKARKAAAAAGSSESTPARQEPSAPSQQLSAKQKELKVQLSMAKAQAKKTERALAAAEASGNGDIEQLKSNLQMLNDQVTKLQQSFDESAQSDAANDSNKNKSAKPVLSDDEKKRKVELAMAKAALKKAERALAEAVESNNESTESFQQAVDECQAKIKSLEVVVLAPPAETAITPSADAKPSAKKAKAPLSDEAKKLKIESAMANAAVKKLQRAITSASDDELETLKQQLVEAQQKAAEMQQALDNLTNGNVGEAAVESSVSETPSAGVSASAKKAKAPLSDEAKKLKIESAMANAAVKKLQRAIASAGEDELDTLKQQLAEAEQKAADMKQALEILS